MADLYTLPNSTEGLDQIVIQTMGEVPGLAPLLLLFTYFVVLLGGINLQKARTSTADYAVWSVVASISTLMIALIMSVTAGFISLDWLVVVVVLTIFSGVWLFLDRRPREL